MHRNTPAEDDDVHLSMCEEQPGYFQQAACQSSQ